MAWRFMAQPNGLLAVFDEHRNNLNGYNMTIDEALSACCDVFEMSKINAVAKIQTALISEKREPLHRFNEAMEIIKEEHGESAHNKAVQICSEPDDDGRELGDLPEGFDFSVTVRGEMTSKSAAFVINALQLSNGDWRFASEGMFTEDEINAAKAIDERIKELSASMSNDKARFKAKEEFLTKATLAFHR